LRRAAEGLTVGLRIVVSSVTVAGSALPVLLIVILETELICVKPLNSTTLPVTITLSPTLTAGTELVKTKSPSDVFGSRQH
jgi:hypothetical protein